MELHPPALARQRTCLPRWGDLRAQRLDAVRGLDVDAFETWALVYHGGGRRASTVKKHMRQIRFLSRAGVDWGRFLRSPLGAEDEAGRFLAPLVRAERRQAVRNYKKTFNWVAAFHARSDPRFKDVHWPLPMQERVEPRRLNDEQMRALRCYSCRDLYLRRRRRALSWFLRHTGLRRGEIGDLKTTDLDPRRRTLLVGAPRKNGKRREIPLPAEAWDPMGDVQLYLDVRVDVDGDWFWTTDYHGQARRMTGDSLYNTDLADMSAELGFRISFTNVRHKRGRDLRKKHRQPIDVVQAAYGHSDPKTTMTYVDEHDAEDLRASYARGGVPGFRSTTPRGRQRSPVEDDVDDAESVIEDVAAWAHFVSGGAQEEVRVPAGI